MVVVFKNKKTQFSCKRSTCFGVFDYGAILSVAGYGVAIRWAKPQKALHFMLSNEKTKPA